MISHGEGGSLYLSNAAAIVAPYHSLLSPRFSAAAYHTFTSPTSMNRPGTKTMSAAPAPATHTNMNFTMTDPMPMMPPFPNNVMMMQQQHMMQMQHGAQIEHQWQQQQQMMCAAFNEYRGGVAYGYQAFTGGDRYEATGMGGDQGQGLNDADDKNTAQYEAPSQMAAKAEQKMKSSLESCKEEHVGSSASADSNDKKQHDKKTPSVLTKVETIHSTAKNITPSYCIDLATLVPLKKAKQRKGFEDLGEINNIQLFQAVKSIIDVNNYPDPRLRVALKRLLKTCKSDEEKIVYLLANVPHKKLLEYVHRLGTYDENLTSLVIIDLKYTYVDKNAGKRFRSLQRRVLTWFCKKLKNSIDATKGHLEPPFFHEYDEPQLKKRSLDELDEPPHSDCVGSPLKPPTVQDGNALRKLELKYHELEKRIDNIDTNATNDSTMKHYAKFSNIYSANSSEMLNASSNDRSTGVRKRDETSSDGSLITIKKRKKSKAFSDDDSCSIGDDDFHNDSNFEPIDSSDECSWNPHGDHDKGTAVKSTKTESASTIFRKAIESNDRAVVNCANVAKKCMESNLHLFQQYAKTDRQSRLARRKDELRKSIRKLQQRNQTLAQRNQVLAQQKQAREQRNRVLEQQLKDSHRRNQMLLAEGRDLDRAIESLRNTP